MESTSDVSADVSAAHLRVRASAPVSRASSVERATCNQRQAQPAQSAAYNPQQRQQQRRLLVPRSSSDRNRCVPTSGGTTGFTPEPRSYGLRQNTHIADQSNQNFCVMGQAAAVYVKVAPRMVSHVISYTVKTAMQGTVHTNPPDTLAVSRGLHI